jgi:hypothetical protein
VGVAGFGDGALSALLIRRMFIEHWAAELAVADLLREVRG